MFVKGKSGNPNGRPKVGECFTPLLRELLNRDITTESGRTLKIKEAILQKMIQLALEGDTYCAVYLINRVDGIPKPAPETDDPISMIPENFSIRVQGLSPETAAQITEGEIINGKRKSKKVREPKKRRAERTPADSEGNTDAE